MTRTKKIGLDTNPPSKSCEDPNCPFHGTLKTRGKQFTGVIVSDKMQKSATVEWSGRKYVPKYERYKKTRTRIIAHNPDCIAAAEGDLVKVAECRPLSKKKNFVIVAKLGEDSDYELRKEALEEGKYKEDKRVEERKTQEKKAAKEESPQE